VRRCGRSMNRQVRDRGTGMRLTERTRELIPETRRGISKGTISYIRNEDDVGGQARVTRDEDKVQSQAVWICDTHRVTVT